MKTKNMTQSAAIAALICAAGILTIYVGPIPMFLATLAVCLAVSVPGRKKGTITEGLHLLIEKGRKEMKTKDMTLIAMMAALICVAGPLTIPVGPIPLSLATFAVYLAGSVLGRKKGTIAVGLYPKAEGEFAPPSTISANRDGTDAVGAPWQTDSFGEKSISSSGENRARYDFEIKLLLLKKREDFDKAMKTRKGFL